MFSTNRSSVGKTAIVAILTGILLGCANNSLDKDTPTIDARAQLPLESETLNSGMSKVPVTVGDVFVYDNPVERWEVISTDKAYIYWRSNSGMVKQTSWSTLFPNLRWLSPNSSGYRQIIDVSDNLFPLVKGNKITFTEQVLEGGAGTSYRNRWMCQVEKQIDLVVAAGKASTWQILCKVNGREYAIYNYSEKIGHYIRSATLSENGETQIRQLTEYARGSKNNQ